METSVSNLWPYSERSSVDVAADIDSLLAQPERPLSDKDKRLAFAFSDVLFDGSYDISSKSGRNLEEAAHTSIASFSQKFYLDYFDTEKGIEDLRKLGIGSGGESLRHRLFVLSDTIEPVKPSVRKSTANNSLNWYKQELAIRLRNDPDHDKHMVDCPTLTVNFAPDMLLGKFEELQSFRRFYRHARQQLRTEDDSDVTKAKHTLLDVYTARVNSIVAALYPDLTNLAMQLASMPESEKVNGWSEKLHTIAPIAARALAQDEAHCSQSNLNFARRLDLLTNGGAWRGEPNFSPVSPELSVLERELSEPNQAAQTTAEQSLPNEVIETLRSTYWKAGELKFFCEAVLEDWALLSEYETDWEEVGDRSGCATDKKWQVVVSPKVTSLSVDGKKKLMTVPQDFDRTLAQISPAGALPGAAHELTHVLQNEYDQVASKDIALIRVKGRKSSTGREMGGILAERELQAVFGQIRPTNLTYLRALEAKLCGSNQTEAARAFVNAERGQIAFAKKAETAGKNVLRLYRKGGHDSQALDYVEQELMLRSLDDFSQDQIRPVAVAGVSLSFKDAAALHRFGLFNLPATIPENPTQDVLRLFMEKFYKSH